MRSSFRRRTTVVLAAIGIAILAIAVAGCGGDDDEEPVQESPAEAPQDEEQGAEEPPEEELTGVALGEQVFQEQACGNCHSIGTGAGAGHGTGPSLGDLFGSRVNLADGSTVRANEAYVRRAIQEPDAEIVQGFSAGEMSAAVEPGSISGEELDGLVAYIRSLGDE